MSDCRVRSLKFLVLFYVTCVGSPWLKGLSVDGFNLDDGKMLAVSAAALVALATLLFEDGDLFVLLVFEDGRFDARAFDQRRTEAGVRAFTQHEDFLDTDGVAGIGVWVDVNLEDVALGDGELSALCTDCRFHGKSVVAKHSRARNQAEFRLF